MALSITLLTVSLASSVAQAQTAVSRAETAFNTLQQFYNTTTGLWNTCGWWNGANCMTAIGDLAAIDSNVKNAAVNVFATTYRQAPAYNPQPVQKTFTANNVPLTVYPAGWPNDVVLKPTAESTSVNPQAWLDGSYDDNAWWALAWIGAYDLTNNANYLQLAQGIFKDMTSSYPSNCSNGGIYWQTSHNYVNAITNELFLSTAAHLANRVPSQKSYYVGWAQRQWAWFQRSGMINAQHLINDGLDSATCKNNGQTTWTYNQGVILGGLAELNRAAPNSTLLPAAHTIAMAAISALTDSNHILHEPCEPNCAPDGTQFKGIFMRNLRMLHAASPKALYKTVIQANADSIWTKDRDSAGRISVEWSGPVIMPANASTHSSGTDALIAAIDL